MAGRWVSLDAMPRPTPLHERTQPLCTSYAFKEWAGKIAVAAYDTHSEREYVALRHSVGLLDISPMYKYDLSGPDAAALAARVCTRDITRLRAGRMAYTAMADHRGACLDDLTVARLARDHVRLHTSEPWFHWLSEHQQGFDVEVTDTTDTVAALSLQGPLAARVLAPLVELDLTTLRYFSLRQTTFAGGIPLTVSRTGFTGDLGFELFMAPEHAVAVWDALMEEGQPHSIEPVGLNALDVARIEAGFILQGVDYLSARHVIAKAQLSTPHELGLGWAVNLDRAPFVGQAALKREAARGPGWATIGLQLDWAELERLYASEGIPPHLAPVACRSSVPVYDTGGHNPIGQVTSSTWSPLLKRYLCIAQVQAPYAREGARLRVEHTPLYRRRQVSALVQPLAAFDPERKTAPLEIP